LDEGRLHSGKKKSRVGPIFETMPTKHHRYGPLAQRIAQPVYSIVEHLTGSIPDLGGGHKLDSFQFLQACLLACVENANLYSVTRRRETLEGVIHPDTYVKHSRGIKSVRPTDLNDHFQNLFDRQVKEVLGSRPDEEPLAALDYHEQVVYIKSIEKSPLRRYVVGRVVKGQKVWVLQFLTCSLVLPHHHVASIRFVSPIENGAEVLSKMVDHLRRSIGIRRYLLDRGFFSREVIEFFESSDLLYLMPVPKSPRVKPLLEEGDLELSLFEGSYDDFITARDLTLRPTPKHEVKLKVYFITSKAYLQHLRTTERMSFRDKRYLKAFNDNKVIGFATNFTKDLSAKVINRMYKKRWRIETGYRMIEDLMPCTSTSNISMRVFWFSLACALENVWEDLRRTGERETMYDFRKAVAYLCDLTDKEIFDLICDDSDSDWRRRSFKELSIELRSQRRYPLAG
jgi:IS4 transposase